MSFLNPKDPEDAIPRTAPGEQLLTGYDVVSLMRRGNRLDTYDVFSTERGCRCVVKVLRPDRQHEEACRTAVVREGELLRDLTHPHLVRAYEVVEAPRTAVVLETLSGATLAALVEQGPLGPHDTALLGSQLVSVLGYLHRQGWLHLDVKPSNVVVQSGRAILIDLSLVARPGDGRPHAGTDGYLGPEQVTGVGLTTATDVFGLGVTLGEA
ncbi:MAG: serine/threonine protein kinase, partial [Nocardioides sp.]